MGEAPIAVLPSNYLKRVVEALSVLTR